MKGLGVEHLCKQTKKKIGKNSPYCSYWTSSSGMLDGPSVTCWDSRSPKQVATAWVKWIDEDARVWMYIDGVDIMVRGLLGLAYVGGNRDF